MLSTGLKFSHAAGPFKMEFFPFYLPRVAITITYIKYPFRSVMLRKSKFVQSNQSLKIFTDFTQELEIKTHSKYDHYSYPFQLLVVKVTKFEVCCVPCGKYIVDRNIPYFCIFDESKIRLDCHQHVNFFAKSYSKTCYIMIKEASTVLFSGIEIHFYPKIFMHAQLTVQLNETKYMKCKKLEIVMVELATSANFD